MKSIIVALILTVFLYSSTQAQPNPCTTGNPCGLDDYFSPKNGYHCIPNGGVAFCTCPDGNGIEIGGRCRLCGRSKPAENVCRNNNGKLIMCLENREYGTSYACLCSDDFGGDFLTTDADCDPTHTVTLTTPSTTTTTLGPSSLCLNGGALVNSICHCPSGYTGPLCADKNDVNLCDRVFCKNNGTCAIRNYNGPYEAVCLCRYGTWGEYCELTGTLGYCSASSCLNGGACKENIVGTTRHAYCQCPAGYNGVKCETRYFPCPGVGKYADQTSFMQGKYFECINVGGTIRAEQRSCPRGLRYNANLLLCTY